MLNLLKFENFKILVTFIWIKQGARINASNHETKKKRRKRDAIEVGVKA